MAEEKIPGSGAATAVPRRLPALPVPPPLESSGPEECRKRTKEIERKLRAHKAKPCLSDADLQKLFQELDQLQDQGSTVDEGTGGNDRRLAVKKEIREIEKQLKALKKSSHRDAKQMAALDSQLERLKSELTNLQRKVLLTLQLQQAESPEAAAPVTLALGERISIAGLLDRQSVALCNCFATNDRSIPAEADAAEWTFWRHAGLRTAAIRSADMDSLAQELTELASLMPHVLCIRSTSLQARGGICAVLRDFKGALVVIEEADEKWISLPANAALLHAVGVSARWCIGPGAVLLQPAVLPAPLQGEVLGDLRWRDVKENADMALLVEEAEALCQQEFSDELAEVVDLEGVRLGVLVPSLSNDGGENASTQKELLGFIIYKFWGPPLKAMSITRIAVPKRWQMQGFGRQLVRWAIEKAKQKPRHECTRVTLCAMPEAIPFYERLNFTAIPNEELPEEEVPEMPGAVKMEYNYGRGPARR